MKAILISLSLFFIFSCKNTPTPLSPSAPAQIDGYLNQQQINELAQQADFVDFIFYHIDISVSQSDLASVQQTTLFLTSQGKPVNMSCPAIGRLSIQGKGKIIKEVDIHFVNKTCGYFTFIEDKKPVGTCLMATAGIKFFESILASYQPKK